MATGEHGYQLVAVLEHVVVDQEPTNVHVIIHLHPVVVDLALDHQLKNDNAEWPLVRVRKTSVFYSLSECGLSTNVVALRFLEENIFALPSALTELFNLSVYRPFW